ncbi:MAG: transglycosylase domain-containing protein, partial [Lachnoclostridium sp.]|nr:transglycosylase domain-containing protein [Lachnoclostridium sp.]
MDFSRRETEERKNRLKSKGLRISHKIIILFCQFAFLAVIILVCAGIMGGAGLLQGLFDTAPDISKVNIVPTGYATRIFDEDGKRIQTLVGENANREYVTLDRIPKHVQDAFIAVEDERFWSHHGIDIYGVLRAAADGFRNNDFSQGASTLTQQLLKNQVFDGGNEIELIDKIKRKLQEQYLAVELENEISKEDILEYYLNTINLGQNTLGVQAASKRYFGKRTEKLTISEAAVIAGITQNPSGYNPITHTERNRKKRAVVLSYMKDQNLITPQEYSEAIQDKVYKRIRKINKSIQTSTRDSGYNSYFTDALIEQVLEDLKDELGYTETQAYDTLYRGGLKIYTTQDRDKQQIVDEVIGNEKYYPIGSVMQLSYRLSLLHSDKTETHYDETTLQNYYNNEKGMDISIYFRDKKEAKRLIRNYKKAIMNPSDKITGETVDFVIQPQVSFVLMDQETGQVKAISGGRGDKKGDRTLNRATGSLRQPGSTFKIVSVYLPALDTSGMTLATTKDDAEYFYPGTKRRVKNWYSTGYRGLTTLREGIINSMNIVTVKALEEVTPKIGYDYLLNLGFTSLVENMEIDGKTYTDIALPMALGGLTKGVSNVELTTSFAAIANQGVYNKASFYT